MDETDLLTKIERSEAERRELLQAVGEAITAWAKVEDALYTIFHLCIGGKALGPTSAAFMRLKIFAPN
jgi:hypothetical protein